MYDFFRSDVGVQFLEPILRKRSLKDFHRFNFYGICNNLRHSKVISKHVGSLNLLWNSKPVFKIRAKRNLYSLML